MEVESIEQLHLKCSRCGWRVIRPNQLYCTGPNCGLWFWKDYIGRVSPANVIIPEDILERNLTDPKGNRFPQEGWYTDIGYHYNADQCMCRCCTVIVRNETRNEILYLHDLHHPRLKYFDEDEDD